MKRKTTLNHFILALLFLGIACSKGPKSDPLELVESSKGKASVSAVALPGGRAYYTVAVMGGGFPNKFVRLNQYTFTAGAGTSGTITSQFKYYTQNQSGDHTTNKVLTGFNTAGCSTSSCTVKTCIGFKPGDAWSTNSGTYYLDVNGRLVITWASGSKESWTISYPKTYYARLDIFNSNYNLAHGYGFGSTTDFNTGVTATAIQAAGSLSDAGNWNNNYQSADAFHNVYLPLNQYTVCNANTIKVTEGTNSCPTGNFKSYISTNPSAEPTNSKRKAYRQYQRGDVGCADGGGNVCISPGGGHIECCLQVLDDSGVFRGFIGVEASLGNQVYGGRIISCFYAVKL